VAHETLARMFWDGVERYGDRAAQLVKVDGAWREVQIRVTRGDLKGVRVRTRPGYFGPYPEASRR